MKTTAKSALLTAAGIAIFGGAGYGGWHAWDSGLIPGNPRAPTTEAMRPVVHRAAYPLLLAKGHPCVGPELRIPPDAQGQPGIAQRAVPGQHSVTYLTAGGFRDAEARDRTIRQHGFLARQGYFAESDVMLETDAGPRAAKRFQLTWDGFANAVEHGRANCFHTGVREFVDVKEIQKLPEAVLDLDVYEVAYETRVKDLPAWAATAQAKELFPKLAELAAPKLERARLVRGKEGWLTEADIELQVQASRMQAGARESRYLMDQIRRTLGPVAPLDWTVAAKALDEYLSSEAWLGRSTIACLPLRLQRGGDERNAPFDRNSFSATWYDAPPGVRRDHELKSMLAQLHVLSALEAVGFATLEQVKRGTVNKVDVKSGVRHTLTAHGIEAVGLSGSNCLPAGRMNVELLGVSYAGPTQARLLARAKLSATPDWVSALAERLPALKSLITAGVPLVGGLAFAEDPTGIPGARDIQQKWRVTGLTPSYPEVAADRVPAELQPYLPVTTLAAAMPVKAPLLSAAPGASLPQAAARAPALTPSGRAAPIYGPTPPPSTASSAPRKATTRAPSYPAGDAELHLVAIYEGVLPDGAKRGSQEHPEGIANIVIGKTAKPHMLMLVSYEPVQWRIAVESGGKLARVLAIGMYDQRVTIVGASGVEVVSRKGDLFFSAGIDVGGNWFPFEPRGNRALDAAEMAQAITGRLPTTFQGRYTGSGAFTINASTIPLALPAPKSAATLPPAQVSLRSPFPDAVSGLSLTYGGAGAYTEAWSSRGFSVGKAYFEGTILVDGGLSALPHANIGIGNARPDGSLDEDRDGTIAMIPHGEQRLYENGDVFGVAVDFDAGIVYLRVNGQWVSGPPGSGKGQRFKTRRERLAYFYATGGDDRGRGLTGWRANFGSAPFRHPAPKGYVSWDGAQRG